MASGNYIQPETGKTTCDRECVHMGIREPNSGQASDSSTKPAQQQADVTNPPDPKTQNSITAFFKNMLSFLKLPDQILGIPSTYIVIGVVVAIVAGIFMYL